MGGIADAADQRVMLAKKLVDGPKGLDDFHAVERYKRPVLPAVPELIGKKRFELPFVLFSQYFPQLMIRPSMTWK